MTATGVRAANPIWYFPDLTGLPLNDQYYAFFLTNVFPYTFQPVFQTQVVDISQGTPIPWNNPLEFFPNGTLPDNLYFNPAQVYRIEIRQGPTQADPLIYEINDFVPGGGGSTPSAGVVSGFGENQATMSQFSEVLFSGTLHITTANTYHVAPGWDLVLTGVGTADVTQVPIAGNQDFVNNPTFALGLNLNGWTTANLVQRFNHNGAIWSSTLLSGIPFQDGYISMSITAQALGSSYTPITFIYRPSTGSPINIGSTPGNIATGSYQVYDQTQLMPVSANSDLSDVAYVDMVIQLKGTGNILISNVQIVGQEVPTGTTPAPVSPPYQQESNERQLDHTFHYYKDSIILQPKDTIVTGWNFPLNPFQFITQAVTTNVAQTKYIADQTILHQEAASQIATGIATNPDRFGLKIQAVSGATTTKFAIFQYIDTTTTYPYWSYKLSALVKLRFNSSHSTNVRFKMLLMYRLTIPTTVGAAEPITGWAGDDLALAAGWTAIKPLNDPIYTASNSSSGADVSYAFNSFQLPTASSDTMYLAAVFYTVDQMNSTAASEDYFVIDKISLVNNDFAIDTQPQTFDDVMRQCQFYYEKSYDYLVLPGTASALGALTRLMTSTLATATGQIYAAPFEIEFNTVKRVAPTTLLYNGSNGVVNTIHAESYRNGALNNAADVVIGFWTPDFIGTKSISYATLAVGAPIVTATSGADNLSGIIRFQYSLNALLGSPSGIP